MVVFIFQIGQAVILFRSLLPVYQYYEACAAPKLSKIGTLEVH